MAFREHMVFSKSRRDDAPPFHPIPVHISGKGKRKVLYLRESILSHSQPINKYKNADRLHGV